jgi:PIN domain nuclease of toxin-antitoxin system
VTFLLDTRTFLWWVSEKGARLSERARDLISTPGSTVMFSVASAYEIAMKVALGKLELPAGPARYLPDRIARHGFLVLPIALDHATRAGLLPSIHRDPWDRLLIAQAQQEGIGIVTADPLIAQYDVETIW